MKPFDERAEVLRASKKKARDGNSALSHVVKKEIQSAKAMVRLVTWAKAQGLEVRVGKGQSEFNYVLGIVSIARKKRENMLFELMHECGHSIFQKTERHLDIRRKGWSITHETRSLTHKINILNEEIRSWELGAQLAKNLRIRYDHKRYARYSARMIKSYCRWIVES